MTVRIQWYGRKPDFSPDYDDVHGGNIHGETAGECMGKWNEYRRIHDLARFTPTEIVYISD